MILDRNSRQEKLEIRSVFTGTNWLRRQFERVQSLVTSGGRRVACARAALGQHFVLGDGRRGGPAGGAGSVAERLVEALRGVRSRSHFALEQADGASPMPRPAKLFLSLAFILLLNL